MNIPDVNFKNALLNFNPPIDTNGDGEIQVSEAENFADFQLRLNQGGISDLTGLEAFINLKNLRIQNNGINEINLTALVSLEIFFLNDENVQNIILPNSLNLKYIGFQRSNLTELDLSNYINLETIVFLGNSINPVLTNLEIPNTSSLKTLNVWWTLIDDFDIENLTSLETFISLSNPNITSLDVSSLFNLTKIQIVGNSITEFNVNTLINLEELSISSNNLSSIDVSENNELKILKIGNQEINTVDISNLTLLEQFFFNSNDLTTVDVSNNTNLKVLSLVDTNLATIDLSSNVNLERLILSDTSLSELDLSNNPLINELEINNLNIPFLDIDNLTLLDYFECNNTSLSTIDLSQNINLSEISLNNSEFENLDFSNNINISQISVDGSLDLNSMNLKNTTLENLNITAQNNPNLNFICVDDVNEATAQNWNIPPFTSFVEDCSLADGELNRIEGTVTYDANGNNCGAGSYGVANYLLNATDGVSNFANSSNENGEYEITVSENTYITQVLGLPPYFDTNPATATNTFVGFDQTQTADFCVQPNTTANDLTVAIFPINAARPGFEAQYEIVYENVGTTTLTGDVTVAFSDVQVDFVESAPSPTGQTTSTLTFNVGTLVPFQEGTIEATFLLEQPPVNESGDVLPFTVTISPTAGDATPEDNEFYFPQVIVNSFDPNDKTCVQGHQILVEDADQYLHYIVRFQNLGTASAINVRVVDVLDELLDFSTFRVLTASHDMETTLIEGQIDFIFDNINLPAEINDPEGSNGYVTFKIKPLPGIILGDEVNNRADIYFDFNPPVLTNVTSTTYVDELGIEDNLLNDVIIYPNPTQTKFNIQTAFAIESLQILNTLGQEIKTAQISADGKVVDVSSLAAGMYFIKVTTAQGTGVFQVLKE
ncbi:hypothetical protein ULMS_02320 [Patiriisocius marinistellae]|uniref:Uncharacterized protein n=1 Tax=Patiriisocius marinistellae TaxID=2494560 RepID=A0A5J4FUM9_9FLAO|nr:hypothetical protein ULMS_02320 [Patiriisocius marinistellae]